MMFLVVLLLLAMIALLIGLYAVLAELDDGRSRQDGKRPYNRRSEADASRTAVREGKNDTKPNP